MEIKGKDYKALSDAIANLNSETWHVRSHHPELEDDGCLRMLEDKIKVVQRVWEQCQED